MPEVVWLVLLAAAALALAAVAFFWSKGRKIAGDHVFRASRLEPRQPVVPDAGLGDADERGALHP